MSRRLADAWHDNAERWIEWARRPGHDSYWRFHRERFLEIVPDPGPLTIDVGCGEGRVGRDLAAAGHRVVGVDASPTLVRACIQHPDGHLAVVGDAGRVPFGDDVAALVVAFMSLHDVDDLTGAIDEIARVLADEGRLHLAIVHPLNSAGNFDATGVPQPFVIGGAYTAESNYADDVERDGLTMTFHSRHRPLQTYTAALAEAGFVIETLAEVTDPDPGDKWSRIPLFLHIVARLDRPRVSRG